jgi:hypothetical protein
MTPDDDAPLKFRTQAVRVRAPIREGSQMSRTEDDGRLYWTRITLPYVSIQHCSCCGDAPDTDTAAATGGRKNG